MLERMQVEDAEIAVLASMLHDQAALHDAAAQLNAGHFTRPASRQLFERLAVVATEGKSLDYWALSMALESAGAQEQIALLEQAWSSPRSAGMFSGASSVLRIARQRRELGDLLARADQALNERPPDQVVTWLIDQATRLMAPAETSAFVETPEALEELYAESHRRHELSLSGQQVHLDLGLPRLSRMLAIEPGHLVLLTAETGKGKTTVALWVALHLGWRQQIPVLYANTEMTLHELASRLVGMAEDVSVSAVRLGANERALSAAYRAKSRYQAGQLVLSRELPLLDSSSLAAIARRYKASHDIRVLIVDYVQRLDDARGDRDRRQWEALIEITQRAKSLAQQLGIVVILVGQLTDQGKLAQSRGMERDADAHVALEMADHRTDFHTHDLDVRKNRHGVAAPVPIRIDPVTLAVGEVDHD